jgi:GNAT superfamily N-acetyltransferase
MPVKTRIARVSDAAALADLTAQLGYEVQPAVAAARLARILERPDQRFWVAEIGDGPVGWIHAAAVEYLESGPFVVIAGLVVDRRHRRQGIGRALLREAEEWAAAEGRPLVRLNSSASRAGAHRFYETLGYAKIKTQYGFAKALDALGPEPLKRLVPKVDS